MQNQFTLHPASSSLTLSAKQSAEFLGTSLGSVKKMQAHALLPDLSIGTVATLANRLLVSTRNPITLIRLGVPDLDTDGRKIGFHPTYTDHELLEAARQWWVSDPDKVCADRHALVVVGGGFIAGALEIHNLEDSSEGYTESGKKVLRHSYRATLLARIDNLQDLRSVRDIAHAPAEVLRVLGQRVPGIPGGPVIRFE